MSKPKALIEQVRQVDADQITLPVLRDLVREVQTKTPEKLGREAQCWSDSNWKQWRQHSNHNPW